MDAERASREGMQQKVHPRRSKSEGDLTGRKLKMMPVPRTSSSCREGLSDLHEGNLISALNAPPAMSSAAAAVAAEHVVLKALEEAVTRIARKAAEGKKLSDKEVSVLMMSTMMRRLEDFRGYMDKRLEDFDRRLDDLKGYVNRRFDDVDKRLEDLKGYVDGRFNAVEKRMDAIEGRLNVVHSEVSSIKTDIIKMMRELLDRAYGERRA
jgi:tetrahydromethanopterin S-methyltransferase subunit G